MALFEQLESGLAFVVTLLKFLLESIAVFCVLLGVLKTGQIAIFLNRHHSQNRLLQIRLNFGIWLVLALEFQLGADILSTTLTSTFESLGKLGIVALIRTFLNYFLTQELDKRKEK
ncbi:MAG: DUF1622 domain-containing protein [Nostoc sp. DedQUE01]|uniref:DUF1622 domain-containing protein n=1 Tax=Nostoc sp. CCY 9925 TaxID=3103865 RepID=UPI0039373F7E